MRNIRNIATFLTVAVFILTSSPLAFAQKGEIREIGKSILIQQDLAPAPIFVAGNPNCATLNANNAAYPHISANHELKLDFGSPNGQFFFNTGQPGVVLNGPVNATRSVSVSTSGNTFRWSSNLAIAAVIVKGGPNANVYSYNPISLGGNPDGFGLTTPDNGGFGVSHVSFCYGADFNPSAATVEVSGQVLDTEGRAIRGAMIEVWNVSRDEYTYAQTNNFGFYTVAELMVGDFYIVTARHGRHVFGDNSRSFTLDDAVSDLNFVAIQ